MLPHCFTFVPGPEDKPFGKIYYNTQNGNDPKEFQKLNHVFIQNFNYHYIILEPHNFTDPNQWYNEINKMNAYLNNSSVISRTANQRINPHIREN